MHGLTVEGGEQGYVSDAEVIGATIAGF